MSQNRQAQSLAQLVHMSKLDTQFMELSIKFLGVNHPKFPRV